MFNDKSDSYDALKSYYIFKKTEWNTKTIEELKGEMINILLEHYGQPKLKASE